MKATFLMFIICDLHEKYKIAKENSLTMNDFHGKNWQKGTRVKIVKTYVDGNVQFDKHFTA